MRFPTILKFAAILLLLVMAPFAWLDMIDATLHPYGGSAPAKILVEYFVAYGLTIASLFVVPFLRSHPLRIAFSVLIIASVCFDQAILVLSGDHANQELISLMWQQRDNAADGLSFVTDVASHIVRFVPLLLIFMLAPARKRSLRWPFAIVPVLAFALTYHNVTNSRPDKVHQPPVFALAGQISNATKASVVTTNPPADVGYAGSLHPRITKIVFIVDESVGARFMSLNNDTFDSTPFLSSLSASPRFFNYGEASSIANCSSATRLLLRTGLRESELPDRARKSLTAPNIWQYAKRAGFKTIYFDAFRTPLTFHSYMGPIEARSIDQRFALGSSSLVERDTDIARQIMSVLDEPGPALLYVEKAGVHYPHKDSILPQGYAYTPKGVGEYGDSLELSEAQRASVSSYLKGIKWRVDDFFKILEPAFGRGDTVFIYTSDHGQNMFQSSSKFFHCSVHAEPTEASVPLFAITGNTELAGLFSKSVAAGYNASSQFELFPTLLDLMGFDHDFVLKNYGETLFDPVRTIPRRFLLREPFQGAWRSFDGDLVDNGTALLEQGWMTWPRGAAKIEKSANVPTVEPFCSYDITLNGGGGIAAFTSDAVPAGSKLEGAIWLWADRPVEVNIALARQWNGKWEAGSKKVDLSTTPRRYAISHTFANDQQAARIQVNNPAKAMVSFHACAASIRRHQSEPATALTTQ